MGWILYNPPSSGTANSLQFLPWFSSQCSVVKRKNQRIMSARSVENSQSWWIPPDYVSAIRCDEWTSEVIYDELSSTRQDWQKSFWVAFSLFVFINFQALKGEGQKMNSYLYIRSLRSFDNFSAFVVLQSLNLGCFNETFWDISNISATYFFPSYLKCVCVCVFSR